MKHMASLQLGELIRMEISEITRRDLFDAMRLEGVNWSGRLEEQEFLARIYDLSKLPSFDHRFRNVAGDIWQHRVNNLDWEDDWIFSDSRFGLYKGDDQILLRFLCETLHPVVRSDSTDVERLKQLYNTYLKNDGYEIVEKMRISNKPVFVARRIGLPTPGLNAAKATFKGIDTGYVAQQITRMEAAVEKDPGLAIGTAKELTETCLKTILADNGIEIEKNWDLPQLTKRVFKELKLTPDDIPSDAKAADIIKRLLSNLATITNGLAELRNEYGTGHGKSAKSKGLQNRHAKLAVGAASTLAVFLIETHETRLIKH